MDTYSLHLHQHYLFIRWGIEGDYIFYVPLHSRLSLALQKFLDQVCLIRLYAV